MPEETGGLLRFLHHSVGKTLIALGALLVFVAVILMTRLYQFASCWSFVFGITFASAGIALHFESPEWKVPSIEGLGTIMIYTSPVFFAAAVANAFFTVPIGLQLMPLRGRWARSFLASGSEWLVYIFIDHPNAWLFAPLVWSGLALLGVGCLLKFGFETF